MEKTLRTCDMCGRSDDVERYTVESEDERSVIDLCPEHQKLLQGAIGKANTKPIYRRRAPGELKVRDVEDIPLDFPEE